MARLADNGELDYNWMQEGFLPGDQPPFDDPSLNQLNDIFTPPAGSRRSQPQDTGDPTQATPEDPSQTVPPPPPPTATPPPPPPVTPQTGYTKPGGTGYLDVPQGGFTVDANGVPTNLPAGYHWNPKTAGIEQDASSEPDTKDPIAWLQQLLSGYTGSDLENDIISKYNSTFNTHSGTGAALYKISGHNVIGLPPGVGGPYGGYFTDEGGWHFVPRIAPEGGAGAGAGTGAGAGAGTPGSVGQQGKDVLSQFLAALSSRGDPNSALRGQLTGQFHTLMDRYSQPVSPDDPIIKANTDAYHGAHARELGNYGEALAERAHAEGVPTGAFDAAIGNAYGAAGRDEAQYTGNQMTSELQQRRGALANILQQAGSYLSDQDRMALQDKLSLLDQAIRQGGMEQQNQQFYDQLSAGLGQNASSLDALVAELLRK